MSGRAETQKFCLTGSPPLPIVAPRCTREYATKKYGEVSEWLKEHAWKVCIRVSVSRVRTPPSPPSFKEKAWICVQAFLLYKSPTGRGEKPRQGLTKRMRFGPPKAARRVSAANQALPHRHLLKKKPERKFRLFVSAIRLSVRDWRRYAAASRRGASRPESGRIGV